MRASAQNRTQQSPERSEVVEDYAMDAMTCHETQTRDHFVWGLDSGPRTGPIGRINNGKPDTEPDIPTLSNLSSRNSHNSQAVQCTMEFPRTAKMCLRQPMHRTAVDSTHQHPQPLEVQGNNAFPVSYPHTPTAAY